VPAFASLGLVDPLSNACAQAGYATPTPIQVEAIPPLLQGRDLLGLAPTGSGKTAAFALPLLQRLAAGRQHVPRRVRVLVLVPTRELAAQVGEVFRRLGASLSHAPKVAVLFGGVSVNPQDTYSYAASKSGLIHLTRRMAVRLAEDNIVVSAIAPGAFASDMNTLARDHADEVARRIPVKRIGTDEDMAGAAIFLASRASDFVNGQVLYVDGGLLAVI
jgi:NAD(P)-dependent dehydrogenase (short-subunit alcohol dehydrogenase family)